jgi:hypothetical protein
MRGASESDATQTGDRASDERREWPRVSATDLSETALRLANGAEVRLVDLSRGGARLETDRRMLPNSTIAVKLVTGTDSFVATGVVVRSRVIRLSQGGLGYDVAIAFSETLHQLPSLPPGVTATTRPPGAPVTADTASPEWSGSMIQVTATVSHSAQDLRKLFDDGNW